MILYFSCKFSFLFFSTVYKQSESYLSIFLNYLSKNPYTYSKIKNEIS